MSPRPVISCLSVIVLIGCVVAVSNYRESPLDAIVAMALIYCLSQR